jgi:hypothetical protein
MNCQPGDLAVVVEAYNPNNIGLILRVLHSHPNQKALLIEPGDHIWTAQSHQPQTYDVEGALVYRTVGPVPDSYLQPIRGYPLGRDIADGVQEAIKAYEESLKALDASVNANGQVSNAKSPAPIKPVKSIRRRSVKAVSNSKGQRNEPG